MEQERNVIVSQEDPTISRANSLRIFADWLEGLERDYPDLAERVYLHFSVGLWDADQIGEIAPWVRALGTANKRYYSTCIELSRYFGQIRFEVNIQRALACTKKVVGTRVIPERVIPERVEPERVEEIVEWECGPLLGANAPGRTSEATESES